MSPEPEQAVIEGSAGSPLWKARLYSVAVPAALGLLGIAIIVGAVFLGIGEASEPGAGLWPLTIGCVWTLSAAIITWENARGARLQPVSASQRPAIGLGLTLGFILLFSYLGMVPAVLVVTTAWMKLLSDMSWKRIFLASLSITVVLYLLFAVIIQTAFPASVLPLP